MIRHFLKSTASFAFLLALAMTSATPSQAIEMTPCEKKHFDFYYLGKDWDAADAYKKAKQLCKTVKAKDKKKKRNTTAVFGANSN